MTDQITSVATLAGGCFWCLEAVYEQVHGVEKSVSGYSGGHLVNPTYRQVCSETTGHAAAVQLTFDPAIISIFYFQGPFRASDKGRALTKDPITTLKLPKMELELSHVLVPNSKAIGS